MKLLLALLLLTATARTQITLESSDYGTIDTTTLYVTSRTYRVWNYANTTGANQSWDFSDLVKRGVNTYDFIDPNGAPSILTFPETDYAIEIEEDVIAYLENDANSGGVAQIGIAGNGQAAFSVPIDFEAAYSTPLMEMPFPSSYQTSFNQVSGFDITVNINFGIADRARLKREVKRGQSYDAYGTLQLPDGSSYEVIRVVRADTTLDSIFVRELGVWRNGSIFLPDVPKEIRDTVRTVAFWAKGLNNYVLRFELDMEDTVRLCEYLADTYPLARSPQERLEISIGPNPATNILQLRSPEPLEGTISIYGIKGDKLITQHLYGTYAEINVASLAKGIYFYDIRSSSGRKQGRLIVH